MFMSGDGAPIVCSSFGLELEVLLQFCNKLWNNLLDKSGLFPFWNAPSETIFQSIESFLINHVLILTHP
jgi:hypothetical protein